MVLLVGLSIFPIDYKVKNAEASYTPSVTTLDITSTSTTANVDVVPTSSNGTFATSTAGDEVAFGVTTNNLTGYTLSIEGSDGTGELINSNTSDTLETIATATDADTFATGASSTYTNKWGILPSKHNSLANTDYLPAPTTTTAISVDTTNAPNTTANNYTVGLGARINYEKPNGTYTNTFTLMAVGNPITYQINYLDNTGPSGTTGPDVSGLPVAEGSSNITASSFTLSSTTPKRARRGFIGWCDGTVTHNTVGKDICTGTTYQAGASFTFSSMPSSGTAEANLYAMWETLSLYETVASMSKGTQTVAQLQAAITVPTSEYSTLDTSNSGVYEYNSSVFGTATDAGNAYKIYYYRGVLENSVGSYGSDGSAVTYPNYVKLGNTCWRVLRTTGSGGVKMIYNGLYGATTAGSCANITTAAQFSSTSAFDATANSSGKSVVGIGYTYNASYKSTTATTTAGTLFGTNSSNSNTTNSTIKTNIDNWYNSSSLKTNYGSHLEGSAGFCNDRSINSGTSWTSWSDNTSITTPYTSGSSATVFSFGAGQRNASTYQNLSLGCPRSTVDLYTTSSASNGNKRLTNPIALITADEASFAGSGRSNASQGSSYHANSFLRSGSDFSLLSPAGRAASGLADMFCLTSGGNFSGYHVAYLRGVRPAISLSQGAIISSGTGVATDPWEVSW